jgi:hypothetical protein
MSRIDIGVSVSDAQLLRCLAEDVPDMALSIRERLREIAHQMQLNRHAHTGSIRCPKCGYSATVDIMESRGGFRDSN